ncbi:kinase-like protein, partial [Gymnopus androsaceus JB14]
FSQEALVWSQLEHPNVLPFLGTNMDLFPESYCLVSPWCSHGNVMVYLSTHPEADKMGIARLEYLHSRNPPIVHGDLKGGNILVSDLGQCRLADFGLAGMMSALQTLSSSTADGTRGSIRWMAPEFFTNSKPSTVTDMYALGCTIYEASNFLYIMTGGPPFSGKSDAAVMLQVMSGSRPSRPTAGFSDRLWIAVMKCWVDPDKRHTVMTFMDELSLGEAELSYPNFSSIMINVPIEGVPSAPTPAEFKGVVGPNNGNNEPQFICVICDQRFTRKDNLLSALDVFFSSYANPSS